MEKYILECPTCKATTSTKKKEEIKDHHCYYCDSIMKVIYHADSSAPTLWGFVCDEPSQNFDKLKPEFQEKFNPKME